MLDYAFDICMGRGFFCHADAFNKGPNKDLTIKILKKLWKGFA
jgi:hypothetical protein